jgi:glutamate dehydrogenase (NADP+)
VSTDYRVRRYAKPVVFLLCLLPAVWLAAGLLALQSGDTRAATARALGANPVACSDSDSVVHDPAGLDLAVLRQLKEVERRRLRHYVDQRPGAQCLPVDALWKIPCQVALPCATQNELDAGGVRHLLGNGCIAVGEGANMPTTPGGIHLLSEAGVAFAPGQAANAGGVGTSALERQL